MCAELNGHGLFYTAINFDMMEIFQKVKRIFVSESIVSSNIDFNKIVQGEWKKGKKFWVILGKKFSQ